jgi:hypothetical protein
VNIGTKNLRFLEMHDLPADGLSELLIINIINTKFDPQTQRGFEIQLKSNVLPKVAEPLTFLRYRCHALESIEMAAKPSSCTATKGTNHNQRKHTSAT